jgi:uncharacterized protein with HEPN domain
MKSQRPYLADLLERIQMIDEFTADGHEAFLESRMAQESVIRCFEVIGEIIKRLDPTLTALQPQIPWRQFAGFRDILIHQYDKIDMETVWNSIALDLPPLKTAVEALLRLDSEAS